MAAAGLPWFLPGPYDTSLDFLLERGYLSASQTSHPFWEFKWDDVFHIQVLVCCLVLFFAGILCSAAGIGGGGIYVAVLMVCGRLSPHDAVPLSKAVVFSGAIASLIVNIHRSIFPIAGVPTRCVIDCDACRLVVPATLIGTFLGVLLNRHASDNTIVIVLTALLGLMTGMVFQTAFKQRYEEIAMESRRSPPANPQGADDVPLRPGLTPAAAGAAAVLAPAVSSGEEGSARGSAGVALSEAEARRAERVPLVRGEAQALDVRVEQGKMVPTTSDGLLAGGLLIIVVVGGILRFHMHACRAEMTGDRSRIGACSHPVNHIFGTGSLMGDTWFTTVIRQLVWSLPIWLCVVITVYYGLVATREVGWSTGSVATYQVVSVATGLLAGLVGVGGGLILSPFFLLTGMEPAVAVGTSATCVLFTSSSTTMQYVFTDRIVMSLAIVYGAITLLASFMGTSLVHFVQDRFGRKSYITFIVAVGVALSAVLSVVKFVFLVEHPKVDSF